MCAAWAELDENVQTELAATAMRQAVRLAARQADCLAAEIAAGTISDQGGSEALQLLARLLRSLSVTDQILGHA